MQNILYLAEPAMRKGYAALEKRQSIQEAKRKMRPGLFELLGSYDSDLSDEELFEDSRYRCLVNLMVLQGRS